ncbi:MAG TPA: IPT/TIG domain-containing protein, partial [Acidimicrobiia bacterium]|nr:IPT/TIG domain-containing protein [Acidimicrobiia bacterium]
ASGFSVDSDTQVTATAPAGTGVVDVRLTTPAGTSPITSQDRFTYQVPAPSVASLNPTSGPEAGGTQVIITGDNFTGATAVNFGANAAIPITVNSDTQVTATAPAGTGVVDVRVTTPAGTSPTSSQDRFTYQVPAPSVASLNPTSGPEAGGTQVIITGSGFTGTTAVAFGSNPASGFSVDSDTQVTATAPAGTGVVDVTVTNAVATSSVTASDQYRYQPLPQVIGWTCAIDANHTGCTFVNGGDTIAISGSGFTGATAVNFGPNHPAVSFTVDSDTQITAVTPGRGTGPGVADITVTTPGGTSPTNDNDQFSWD